MTFVKYSCGCIGTPPDANGKTLVIEDCTMGNEMCFFMSAMDGKEFKRLPDEITAEYITELATLIKDGLALREIKLLLR